MNGYVIITPAHNEEGLIAKTADSIVAQSIRPMKWVVVNDASTDRTRAIIEKYASCYDFIEIVDREREEGRHFGNKVHAFNEGLARVKDLDFAFVGNLDADITLEASYFAKLLGEFEADPKLGLAGGMVHTTIGGQFVSQEVALDSVAGAVQLFRRRCFEQIGGYRPLPNGGVDAAAEIAVRMNGWTTRTFAELPVREHRLTGSTTSSSPLASRVKEGKRMYSLGYGFLFFGLRCLYRCFEQPAIVGSFAALYGYLRSAILRAPRDMSQEEVRFLRNEQRSKLMRSLGLRTA